MKNRTKKELHKLIERHVIPGSTIYTDEWKSYCGLERLGFVHKTICHSKRFCRFEFHGNLATRITTNHIERMWVELRRSLKYLEKEQFTRCLGVETYRQLHLFRLEHWANFAELMRDFAKYSNKADKKWFVEEQN